MNRALSIRSRKNHDSDSAASPKHRFTMSSLRSAVPGQPELSKKMSKMIKSENHAISAYDSAGRERVGLAQQLSEWGEGTGDDAVSEISDKMGVLLAEIGEQEDVFTQNLEEYRSVLKQIRNMETSVQPSRDHKAKVSDELSKLKYKEPTSTKIVTLEQELVRAEAQSLVAEAQLTNMTRQKFREAYNIHLAAVLERSEKQALLARQAQKLVELLDDSPIVPGQERAPFGREEEVREVIADAERELRAWTPSWQSRERHGSHGVEDPSIVSSPTGTGHTSDGSHLAEVTAALPPTQTHAGSHHDSAAYAASNTATAGAAFPGEAGSVAGSDAPRVVEQPVAHAA